MWRPLRPGAACLAWGPLSHQCGWSSLREGEDVRLDRKAGARLCRQDKEAGFTQCAAGRHWWAPQRVEGDFPKFSIPCCSRILLSTGMNHWSGDCWGRCHQSHVIPPLRSFTELAIRPTVENQHSKTSRWSFLSLWRHSTLHILCLTQYLYSPVQRVWFSPLCRGESWG